MRFATQLTGIEQELSTRTKLPDPWRQGSPALVQAGADRAEEAAHTTAAMLQGAMVPIGELPCFLICDRTSVTSSPPTLPQAA